MDWGKDGARGEVGLIEFIGGSSIHYKSFIRLNYYSTMMKVGLHDSNINLDIVLSCLNIQNNNRYNIYISFSIKYQDCGVKNLVLP